MGAVASRFDKRMLDLVFGDDSIGDTPDTRAASSSRLFVRSQVQIAFASANAKGRLLSSHEALQTFGWEVLLIVATEGSAPLVRSADEPANTLRSQRIELGLSTGDVAKRAGLTEEEVAQAEVPGTLTPIRTLDVLGQTLALDERRLGYQPDAGRDSALGVRLRELRQAVDVAVFGPTTVLDLSEAAWVISRQAYLAKALGFKSRKRVEIPGPNASYGHPAYKIGYSLAEQTRRLLGLNGEEPVGSLRSLIEEVLEIPLVQQTLHSRFAGATIANGSTRGIVVNERGSNSNVWVRRMTMCHELGHLLWDPDTYLEQLKVDEYSGLDGNALDPKRDVVEIRANAFAVAFLAPRDGVLAVMDDCKGVAQKTVSEVMSRYGISATAAKHHVQNIANVDTSSVRVSALPTPTDDWMAQEELSISYFPIKTTPVSRRGKFAWFVAKLVSGGKLSEDTAAAYLKCEKHEISAHLATILDMWAEE